MGSLSDCETWELLGRGVSHRTPQKQHTKVVLGGHLVSGSESSQKRLKVCTPFGVSSQQGCQNYFFKADL